MTLRILGLPSSPKGEIVGIMTQVWRYGISVVLDGNSLKWKITVQALKMIENEIPAGAPNKSHRPVGAPNERCDIPAGSPNKKCGRQIHTLSCREAHARGKFYD